MGSVKLNDKKASQEPAPERGNRIRGSVKLNDKMAGQEPAPERGNRIIYDSEVKGFGLRLTPFATKPGKGRSFILTYRVNGGQQRRMTIGDFHDPWSVAAARAQAKDLKREIDRGIDPLGVKEKDAADPTVKKLVEDFLDQHVRSKRPETRAAYERHLRDLILPALGRMKVKDVRRGDIKKLFRKASEERGPITGNRLLATLSVLMSFAIDGEHRSDNPCKGIERSHEEGRTRHLSQQELANLMDTLREWPDQQVADAIRLLLLTGARRNEVAHAEWSQFDLERALWTKPSSHVKQKKQHEVPLSAPALELLTRMRAAAEPDAKFLFPSSRQPGQPIGHLSQIFPDIARDAGLKDVHLHDLRHTHASILISGGASLALVGRMLGHVTPAMTQRYSHFHRSPLQEAAELVGSFVTAADRGRTAEVKPLSRRGGK